MQVRSVPMFAAALVAAASVSAQAAVVKVDASSGGWAAFMNVFETQANGGGYVFGSVWGIPDLRATFDDGADTLTLFVNSIDDPNPFWYTPAGGPGAVGNKVMDAVLYRQVSDGSLSDTTVTFEGTVLSNSFAASHVAKVFIRDFAPDFSSFNEQAVEISPGPFSISLDTDVGIGRHVQWGFSVTGPCVWITDFGAFGSAVIATEAGTVCVGDLNNDTFVDDTDFVIFASAYNILDCADPTMPAGCPADLNGDDIVDDSDFVLFAAAYNELICP